MESKQHGVVAEMAQGGDILSIAKSLYKLFLLVLSSSQGEGKWIEDRQSIHNDKVDKSKTEDDPDYINDGAVPEERSWSKYLPSKNARAKNLTNHKNSEGKQRHNGGVRPSVGILG